MRMMSFGCGEHLPVQRVGKKGERDIDWYLDRSMVCTLEDNILPEIWINACKDLSPLFTVIVYSAVWHLQNCSYFKLWMFLANKYISKSNSKMLFESPFVSLLNRERFYSLKRNLQDSTNHSWRYFSYTFFRMLLTTQTIRVQLMMISRSSPTVFIPDPPTLAHVLHLHDFLLITACWTAWRWFIMPMVS